MTDILAIRRAAMNLLARRDHSRYELQQKLIARFPDKAALKQVIEQLCQEGLQNDSRFADMYVRYRVARGYGAQRIRQELGKKGISDDDIAKAFRENDLVWQDVIEEVYRRKYGEAAPSDAASKAKCSRFLLSRGFSFSEINQLWRSKI